MKHQARKKVHLCYNKNTFCVTFRWMDGWLDVYKEKTV